MNFPWLTNLPSLAADEPSRPWDRLTSAHGRWKEFMQFVEFDLPEGLMEWSLYGGGLLLALVFVGWCYWKDSATLHPFWRFWLMGLRLLVLAGLIVVAMNPHERRPETSFRPSRVAVVADTSVSMQYPEKTPAGSAAAEGEQRTRIDAVRAVLADSPLIEKLRQQHEVSIYTFDSSLLGPRHVFYPPDQERSGEANGPDGGSETADQSDSDGRPSPKKAIVWDEVLRPVGLETRLGESLLEAIRQLGGRTLSGILVLSDGASNAGVEPSTAHDVALAQKVRLVTTGVGSTDQPINLMVANLQAPSDVHIGDAYEISAFVQAQGLVGRSVAVELWSRPEGAEEQMPQKIDSQDVQLLEDGIPVEVTFDQMPKEPGGVEFFVRAQPLSTVRELRDDDNERRKSVNVVDRKTRVFLMAGGPMRDYRFVRNMLFRHPAIEVDVWLQTIDPSRSAQVSQESDRLLLDFPGTAAELFEYDVIMAFDPDWKLLTAEEVELLEKWVSEYAGGLFLVAGDVFTSELAQANEDSLPHLAKIRDLFPVFLNSYLMQFQFDTNTADQPWEVALTQEGKDAGFLQLTDDPLTAARVWTNQFGGVYRSYPTDGAKAGATVYAHFSDPRSQTEHGPPVLLASQFYGAGRCMYLGSPELWRLRALDEQYFDRFWTKTIREIAQGRLKRGTARGMLLLERNQYVLGQTARVRAQLLDPQLEPLMMDSVEMEVFDPKGRPLVPPRKLVRDKNRPGQYVGDFRASLAGTYRLELPIPDSSDELVSKVDVVLPNLESDNPRQNAKLLVDLSRDTGGRYLRLEELAEMAESPSADNELAALFPNRGEEFVVYEQIRTLWDFEWVMYLLVGLLCVEWLTRKLLKLA